MIQFYLLDEADGSIRAPLPNHAGYTLSPIMNSPGSIDLNYPTTGRNFDLLAEHLEAGTDAPVEMWVGGSRANARQGLLIDATGDEAKRGHVWNFVGNFDEVRLRDAVVKPGTGETSPDPDAEPDQDAKFFSATAGRIMATFMQDAQARGTLTALTWTFTEDVDSNGVAWSKVQTLKFSPGVTYLEVVQALVEYGLCEFDVRSRELRLYEFGTRGTDRTLETPPVRFIRGRDVRDAPRRRTVRESITDLLLSGSDGLYEEINDPSARARRARQIEGYRSQGSLNTSAGLTAYGQVELERAVAAVDERTHGLSFRPGSPLPLVDFEDGDWVWSKMGSGMRRLRVRQLTVSEDAGRRREGTVTLNDLIAEREAQLARRIRGIEGGSTITGTSQARDTDDEDDTTPPAAPEGLTAASDTSTSTDGATTAVIFASWAEVTEDEGGGATSDVRSYQVQYRYLDDDQASEWRLAAEVDGASADFGGLLTDEQVEVRVRAVDTSGNRSLWSTSVFLTTAFDETPPPVPSAPSADNYLGIIRIGYDGLGSVGEQMPGDYDRTQALASTTSDFTMADAPLAVAEMVGESVTAWSPAGSLDDDVDYGTTWFIKLRSRDRSGNWSDLSEQASAVPGKIGDVDVASLSVALLTSGIMDAIVSIAGEFRTADPPDPRVTITSSGVRKYDDDNALRVEITDEVTRIDGEITVSDAGSLSEVTIGVGSSSQRANIAARDDIGDLTALIGQTYDAETGEPTNNGVLVTRSDPLRNLFRAYGSGAVVGVRINRSGETETGPLALRVVDGESDLLRMTGVNGTQAYLGEVGGNQGILVTDTDGSTQRLLATRAVFQFLLAGAGAQPRIRAATDYAHIGLYDGANTWGFEFTGSTLRIKSNSRCLVVNAAGDGWQDLELRDLYHNGSLIQQSSAAGKDDFAEIEGGSALDVLRAAPSARWRRLGSDIDEVGPVAEDLPGWMRQTFDQPDDPEGEPRGDGVVLNSELGLLWEAVRELDAELDELRREQGRPVPKRRRVAELLGDIESGRIRSAVRRSTPPTVATPPDPGPLDVAPDPEEDPPIFVPPRAGRPRPGA